MNWPIPKPGTTVTEAELLSLGIDPRAPVGKREPGPALDVRCGDDRYTRRASDGGVTVHYNAELTGAEKAQLLERPS